MGNRHSYLRAVLLLVLWLVTLTVPSQPDTPGLAYIGPGAGFAFIGSFLTLLSGLIMGVGLIVAWRLVLRKIELPAGEPLPVRERLRATAKIGRAHV